MWETEREDDKVIVELAGCRLLLIGSVITIKLTPVLCLSMAALWGAMGLFLNTLSLRTPSSCPDHCSKKSLTDLRPSHFKINMVHCLPHSAAKLCLHYNIIPSLRNNLLYIYTHAHTHAQFKLFNTKIFSCIIAAYSAAQKLFLSPVSLKIILFPNSFIFYS